MVTKEYSVEGMTCGSCKQSVEDALNQLDNINSSVVDLGNKKVLVSMEEEIPISDLQHALPQKFTITNIEQGSINTPKKNSITTEKSKLAQLKPLFLILFYISVATVLLHYKNWNAKEAMLDFMGMFFIVFSFFKMLDLKGFQTSFRMYDPLAKQVPFYAVVYPFIETILGLMFLMRFEVKAALIATFVVLGITAVGVTKTLLDKKSIQCACLGTALKLPMTEATFIENAIMIVMAIMLLVSL